MRLGTLTLFRYKILPRIWMTGGLTGLCVGLSFILIHDALTTDLLFNLWEFCIALVSPSLIAILIAKGTRTRIRIVLSIAYLTLLIPILGVSFGASGSEPLWQFGAAGLVGGLLWSTPFALRRRPNGIYLKRETDITKKD